MPTVMSVAPGTSPTTNTEKMGAIKPQPPHKRRSLMINSRIMRLILSLNAKLKNFITKLFANMTNYCQYSELLYKTELLFLIGDSHICPASDFAAQDFFRKQPLDALGNHAAQRPRAKHRIKAEFGDFPRRGFFKRKRDAV